MREPTVIFALYPPPPAILDIRPMQLPRLPRPLAAPFAAPAARLATPAARLAAPPRSMPGIPSTMLLHANGPTALRGGVGVRHANGATALRAARGCAAGGGRR